MTTGAWSRLQLRKALIDVIREDIREAGYDLEQVGDDLEILASGVVDSLRLLEILDELQFDLDIELDPSMLTEPGGITIGGLVLFLESRS